MTQKIFNFALLCNWEEIEILLFFRLILKRMNDLFDAHMRENFVDSKVYSPFAALPEEMRGLEALVTRQRKFSK